MHNTVYTHEDEKQEVEHVQIEGQSKDEQLPYEVDARALRRAELKCDLILVPLVTSFYLLSFIDRANIGNARTAGLQTDLGLSSHQYSVALTVTYVPYIVAEWPTNLLIRRIGPHIVLPLLTFLWGVVAMCQAFVTSYHGLIAVRFFLGLTEGGLLPGIVLTLSRFYRRNRLQFRVALLFCATSLAGAFSGLLAAAILKIRSHGHPGWYWLFLIEGLFTAVFGLVSFFIMPRTTQTAWFLKEDEKLAIEQAMQNDCAGEQVSDPFSWREALSAFWAPQVGFMFLAFFFDGATLFGLAVFSPSIVQALGFGTTETQLLTVPPYAAACVMSVGAAFFADRYRMRGLTAMFFSAIAVGGFAMYYAVGIQHKWTLYGSLVLQVVGAYGTAPTISAWNVNNVSPHYKRGIAIAIAFSTTNCGGILSTWIFTDPPHYTKAALINCIFSAGVILASLGNIAYLHWRNKQKAIVRAEYPGGIMPREPKVVDDSHPSFIYVL